MLSYQHAYHAGCLADVHKHSYLLAVLNRLLENKEKIHYIETHAGRGLYDLESEESHKTGEAEEGIIKVFQNPTEEQKPLCELLKKMDDGFYPGSPKIAAMTLRPTDSIHLAEMHKKEVKALRANMLEHKNAQIASKDGYDFVAKLNANRSHQKLVMIDPSFEMKDEYDTVVEFITYMHEKWPEAHIMLWYPKLKSKLYVEMVERLMSAIPSAKVEEQDFADPDTTERMHGTGLFMVNL